MNRILTTVTATAVASLLMTSVIASVAAESPGTTEWVVDTPVVSDDFTRADQSGWGGADTGGDYAVSNAADVRVASGAGVVDLPKAGVSRQADLPAVAVADGGELGNRE
ncbi:hypothetical protein ACC691_36650, partial [Rhizobium johnstonii]|uniref:hypothetical protein n=1 Tax=Rhizobium johnstonii TaxID=3019933 RepID=UPI003F95E4CB